MENLPPIRFPVLRPLLPTAEAILPYLKRIDASRWYSNLGPLVLEFEGALARHFAVSADRIVTSSNATLALSQTLRALAKGPGFCVMPSWTFVATPAAAVWAGLEPFFVDVDPDSWLISPEQIEAVARRQNVAAAIVTSSFGAPLDLSVWDRFTARTGIPVIIDAAAGFDGFASCGQQEALTPVVISLHATKVSGVGEGAVIVASNAEDSRRIRQLGNFGFHGSRDAAVPGTNAKMSEYSAAIGLAFLEQWNDRRNDWASLTATFARGIAAIPQLMPAPSFNSGWVSSYGLVTLKAPFQADVIAVELRKRGVETRKWWGEGCHLQSAYAQCARDPLPVTEDLGQRVLGLPFWVDLPIADVKIIFETVRDALLKYRSSHEVSNKST